MRLCAHQNCKIVCACACLVTLLSLVSNLRASRPTSWLVDIMVDSIVPGFTRWNHHFFPTLSWFHFIFIWERETEEGRERRRKGWEEWEGITACLWLQHRMVCPFTMWAPKAWNLMANALTHWATLHPPAHCHSYTVSFPTSPFLLHGWLVCFCQVGTELLILLPLPCEY